MVTDDTLWKAIIEDMPAQFLMQCMPQVIDHLDFNKGFSFLDKELETLYPEADSLHPKFVDKLIKVFTKKGREEWILIHIEVQGYHDEDFAKRMFTYFYRILDKYNRPVTSLAIFTDNNLSYKPQEYQYTFLGTKAFYSYNTYKIIEQDEALLHRSTNPFALVVLTVLKAIKKRNLDDEALMRLKIDLFRLFYEKNLEKSVMHAVTTFLKLYVRFSNPENQHNFDKNLEAIHQNKSTMGIVEFVLARAEKQGLQQGLEQGLEQGLNRKAAEVVRNAIEKMGFDDTQAAMLAGVTIEFVQQVRLAIEEEQKEP